MCRPFGTRLFNLTYPALPCRAPGCSVPAGLLPLRRLRKALLSQTGRPPIAVSFSALIKVSKSSNRLTWIFVPGTSSVSAAVQACPMHWRPVLDVGSMIQTQGTPMCRCLGVGVIRRKNFYDEHRSIDGYFRLRTSRYEHDIWDADTGWGDLYSLPGNSHLNRPVFS